MAQPTFFSIIDTKLRGLTALDENNESISSQPLTLRVLIGVDVSPNVQVTASELSNGERGFTNLFRENDTFKINVIINENDTWDSKVKSEGRLTQGKVWEVLDYWIRHTIPVYVVTEAIDIPNGEYLITNNPSRKQEYKKYTTWELEFTRYWGNNKYNWNFQNDISNNAVAAYKKSQQKKNKAKATDPNVTKLKKCKLSNLKYSKTKKAVTCVKYLQNILKKKGFYNSTIDGWYGKVTVEAVKKYQKKYKKYGLKVNGKVDQNTYNCLIGKCGQIGKTKTIKSTLPKASNGVVNMTK